MKHNPEEPDLVTRFEPYELPSRALSIDERHWLLQYGKPFSEAKPIDWDWIESMEPLPEGQWDTPRWVMHFLAKASASQDTEYSETAAHLLMGSPITASGTLYYDRGGERLDLYFGIQWEFTNPAIEHWTQQVQWIREPQIVEEKLEPEPPKYTPGKVPPWI